MRESGRLFEKERRRVTDCKEKGSDSSERRRTTMSFQHKRRKIWVQCRQIWVEYQHQQRVLCGGRSSSVFSSTTGSLAAMFCVYFKTIVSSLTTLPIKASAAEELTEGNLKVWKIEEVVKMSEIRMLDLVLKLLPEDSKEPQTARILLYKLFYDQTEEGMTWFLLNLIKMFDTHKQLKCDLADLVEIIHKVVKLMDNLQSRGALRVSKKSKKIRKKKLLEVIESADKQIGEHSSIQKEDAISIGNKSSESQPLQKDNPSNANLPGEESIVVSDDNEHENVAEEVGKLGSLEPTEDTKLENANEDMLDENADSDDEQLNTISEVDFKVSTLVSTFANHNIIKKLCWLLKFYKSNFLATNHYIISMLRRINDDLGLHAMLYQLSQLTNFYDILVEQKSCPGNEYEDIVDFSVV
ncbi:hypothetical protein PIB30_079280 [Stylosanthes scabra]|uniref:Uncharacterized protein n=1 Tax=Stylosanthes scabra TaxID=79078 RepID=A0ABU6VQ89_9FABA|nr:hypothetical protein [Stylosanthes scabra]